MSSNVYIEQVSSKIKSWKEKIYSIENEEKYGSLKLRVGEKEAFQELKEFWKYNNYNPDRCISLINELKKHENYHIPKWDELVEFRRTCALYYTKERVVFEAFQNALGGKQKDLEVENKIQCPRCLGKGYVDKKDIKRLNKEHYWAPGPCAYCEGIGSVTSDLINSVGVDEAYLTVDLNPEERIKFLLKDIEAVERSKIFKRDVENLKDAVIRLYSEENKNINEIAEVILNAFEARNIDEYKVKELKEFIGTVINKYDE
jgi:hypothetical protein